MGARVLRVIGVSFSLRVNRPLRIPAYLPGVAIGVRNMDPVSASARLPCRLDDPAARREQTLAERLDFAA